MKNIFISGISGLLGSNAAFLLHKKYGIYGQYHEYPFSVKGITAVSCDLSGDISPTIELLEKARPQAVIHCAALANVDACQKEPERAAKINTGATELLSRISAKLGAKFVFISTDAVYKDVPGLLYNEDSALFPLNEYSRTKLAAEESVRKQCSDSLIIRTNIYGYNYQDKLSLGEWVVSNLKASKSISMFRDVVFTPVLVNDLVGAIDYLLQRDLVGVFNVAGRGAITKYDFGRKIADIFGFNKELIKPISVDDFGFSAKRQKNMAMDVEKVSSYIPMPSVEQGVKHFFELSKAGYADKLKKGEWS